MVAALAVLTFFLPPPATGHEGAEGVVKQRMDQMSVMETSLKKIAGMVRSGDDFDREEVIRLARDIRNHGGENMTRLFPESSKPMRSEAEPAIWEEWEAFRTGASDLSRKANHLAKMISSGGDRANVMTAIKELAATCTGCHRKFRRPE